MFGFMYGLLLGASSVKEIDNTDKIKQLDKLNKIDNISDLKKYLKDQIT